MKVISNAFWLSFGRIAADLLSFVLFAAISRTFGPSGTGEYSYAFAIATLISLTSTAGFLGNASVGLYATDIKFVEVGILPLVLLGTAAYPLLSAHAARDQAAFGHSAAPLFGAKSAPAATLLPWFALFAVMKAWEVAFYRLLYAVRRQFFYCGSLIVGTLLLVFLNFQLIPRHGILGAISAAIASILVVDLICAYGLLRQLGATFLTSVAARLALALALTAGAVVGAQKLASAGPWATAMLACGLFPLLGVFLGLVPHPRHSLLLRQPLADNP